MKNKKSYSNIMDETTDALLVEDDVEILDLAPPERKVTPLQLTCLIVILILTIGSAYLFASYYFLQKPSSDVNVTVVENNVIHNYDQPSIPVGDKNVLYNIPGQSIFDIMEDANDPACYDVPEKDRFDCFPEDSSHEEGCYTRGCCWQIPKTSHSFNLTNKPLGTPYCFYPYNYNGYQLEAQKLTSKGLIMFLKRLKPSGFPKDIQEIILNCTFINPNQVRIKIYDATEPRYEVLVSTLMKSLTHSMHYNINNVLYNVNSNLTNLWITRISSGKVIFNFNFAQLVYADQMIQFSVKLPSNLVYGLGETKSTFLKNTNWTRYVLLARDRPPTENMNSYSSHPFYFNLEDSESESTGNSHGVLFLNSNAMEIVLQPTPAVTFRAIGGILDIVVSMGPSPNDVISQYTSIIGNSFLPPYWSLGFHLCRFGYKNVSEVRSVWNRTIQAGIPLDVQWNDIDYMNDRNDFTIDKNNFGDLPGLVKDLHQSGLHYVMIIDPGVSGSEKPGTYPPYDDGIKMNIFIKNASGDLLISRTWNRISTVYPDFTNPKVIPYWTKQFSRFHKVVPFDGAWIDMNEPSTQLDGSVEGCPPSSELDNPPYIPGGIEPLYTRTICMSARQYSSVHYNLHNIYGLTEAIATNIALTDIRQKRPFLITRSSFPGLGRFGGTWDGDIYSNWDYMKWTITSILNLNMYGISMSGADICGFEGNTTIELCARWSALGSFYPFSRNHNSNGYMDQDPVSLGPVVISAAKNALMIRYFLLPHLYTLFHHSQVDGKTVARALFFEFPTDKFTYTIDSQFLLGPAIMIVPVLEAGKTEVEGYLPRGVWYDFSNGTAYSSSSGMRVVFPTPIDKINILLRGGYIIPGQEHGLTTTVSRNKRFTFLILLDENGKAKGDLFWDDGDSVETYGKGIYNYIQFKTSQSTFISKCTKSGFKTTMTLGTIVVYGVADKPANVLLNGSPVKYSYQAGVKVLHCMELNISLFSTITLTWK